MTNLHTLSGLSLPTNWTLPHPPPPKPDFSLLATNTDPNWTIHPLVDPSNSESRLKVAPSLTNLKYYAPRDTTTHDLRTAADIWIRFSTPQFFTTNWLPFVIDSLPYPVEAFRPTTSKPDPSPVKKDDQFWYPTVAMNLEVKRPLEEEEKVEWLFVRMQSKEVRNGRFDLEVVVLDEKEQLVALGGLVGLVLGMERNLGARGRGKI